MERITGVPLIVFVPSLGGVAFVIVATVLRRDHGPWALVAVTLFATAIAVTVLSSRYALEAVFLAPVVPALVAAAGVLEWRSRRAAGADLWRHVLWGTVAFAITGVVGFVVVLAGFKCTGCVG